VRGLFKSGKILGKRGTKGRNEQKKIRARMVSKSMDLRQMLRHKKKKPEGKTVKTMKSGAKAVTGQQGGVG